MSLPAYGVAAWDQSKAEAIALLRRARGPFVVWVVTDMDDAAAVAEAVYAVTPAFAEAARDDIGEQLAEFVEGVE